MLFLVMGVSGCGKSTIAKELSIALQIPFIEADNFHPEPNIAKMKNGQALTDEDRLPWLQNLAQALQKNERNGGVLACSALKESYRATLNSLIHSPLQIIYLKGNFETIQKRMEERTGHFMPSHLLQSQFDALEEPQNVWTFDIKNNPKKIISQILEKTKMDSNNNTLADIGIIGLGVMGKSLARNFASKSFKVAVYNAPLPGEENVVQDFVVKFSDLDFISSNSLLDFVKKIKPSRVILLMVKSGDPVDQLIDQLLPHLKKEDMIIDAGNSYFKDTIRRFQFLEKQGIEFVGMGVSGGEEGALKGPAIMPAGSDSSKNKLLPMLKKIAAVADQQPCVNWIGSDGAGHFVKMIHNGIEYADMQLLTEAYAIAKHSLQIENNEIADHFSPWKKSAHNSYLLDITIDILRFKKDGHYLLENILDVAGHKGTGLWTVREALELGVPAPTITAAMNERILSGKKDLREELASKNDNLINDYEVSKILSHLEDAILFARLIALAEGFYLIQQACKKYDWKMNMAQVAQLWRGGCIIRSDMLKIIITAFEEQPNAEHLFAIPSFSNILKQKRKSASILLSETAKSKVSTPALSAAMNYHKSLNTNYLPINLIQAQRDYFGAHTYRTLEERNTSFHTKWTDHNG